jgi:hypothetical protein
MSPIDALPVEAVRVLIHAKRNRRDSDGTLERHVLSLRRGRMRPERAYGLQRRPMNFDMGLERIYLAERLGEASDATRVPIFQCCSFVTRGYVGNRHWAPIHWQIVIH